MKGIKKIKCTCQRQMNLNYNEKESEKKKADVWIGECEKCTQKWKLISQRKHDDN
jgi:hypothetical protein